MKSFFRIWFSLTVFYWWACSGPDDFEMAMGKPQSRALDQWVTEFELFLNYNYPHKDIKSAYTEFLKNVLSGNSLLHQTHLTPDQQADLDSVIKTNRLWNEIWRMDTLGNDRMEHILFISPPVTDSILITRHFNLSGNYLKALKAIHNSDSVLTEYIKVREIAGDISPAQIARGLLYYRPDFSDQTIKRIMAIEFGGFLWDWAKPHS